VDGKAVAAGGRLCRQHTGVDDAAHAGEEFLGDAGTVALDLVAGAHAIGGDNVRLLARLEAGEQGQVGAAVGVVLDALDNVLAGLEALVVDDADAALVATAPMADGDAASVVAATQMLALALDGEPTVGPALPEMVVDGALEMAQAGGARLVGAQRNELVLARALNASVGGLSSTGDGCQRRCLGLCIGAASSEQRTAQARGLETAYPRLQHCGQSRRSRGGAVEGRLAPEASSVDNGVAAKVRGEGGGWWRTLCSLAATG